jgi:hypothetical protein
MNRDARFDSSQATLNAFEDGVLTYDVFADVAFVTALYFDK